MNHLILSILHDISPVFHIFYLFLFSSLSYLLSFLPVHQFSYQLLVSSLSHLLVCHCFLIPWFVFLISKIFYLFFSISTCFHLVNTYSYCKDDFLSFIFLWMRNITVLNSLWTDHTFGCHCCGALFLKLQHTMKHLKSTVYTDSWVPFPRF